MALDELAELVEFGYVLPFERLDERALLGRLFEEALEYEPSDRLADGRAAHSELPGKARLGDRGPGGQVAAGEPIADLKVGRFREGGARHGGRLPGKMGKA